MNAPLLLESIIRAHATKVVVVIFCFISTNSLECNGTITALKFSATDD